MRRRRRRRGRRARGTCRRVARARTACRGRGACRGVAGARRAPSRAEAGDRVHTAGRGRRRRAVRPAPRASRCDSACPAHGRRGRVAARGRRGRRRRRRCDRRRRLPFGHLGATVPRGARADRARSSGERRRDADEDVVGLADRARRDRAAAPRRWTFLRGVAEERGRRARPDRHLQRGTERDALGRRLAEASSRR